MKYYVTFGDQETVYNASTPYQACMFAFKDFLTREGYVETLPLTFRASQQGFAIHDEDEIIETTLITSLHLLNNQYEEEHSEDLLCPNTTSDQDN